MTPKNLRTTISSLSTAALDLLILMATFKEKPVSIYHADANTDTLNALIQAKLAFLSTCNLVFAYPHVVAFISNALDQVKQHADAQQLLNPITYALSAQVSAIHTLTGDCGDIQLDANDLTAIKHLMQARLQKKLDRTLVLIAAGK